MAAERRNARRASAPVDRAGVARQIFAHGRDRPLVAVVARGLERVAAQEIRSLGGGVGHVRQGRGRLWFSGPQDAVLRANLQLRTVERILVPVAEGRARNTKELYELLSGLPWESLLPPSRAARLAVSTRASVLFHTGAIRDVVHEALLSRGLRGLVEEQVAAPSTRPSGRAAASLDADIDEALFGIEEEAVEDTHEPPPTIDLRGTENRWLACVDSSGRGLHRRGWRIHPGRSPLRETVAAGTLLAAGWNGAGNLLDPMCGVGTFVVEAAALAARRAPGLDRTFAVEHFPETDLERMRELRARARAQIVPVEARLEGADRSGSAVLHAADHLKRIGLPGAAIFARRDAVETPPDDGEGLLILNPPWGLRQDVKTPLPQVVERLKAVRPRWRVVVVSPEERGKVLWTAGVGGLVVRAAVI